jgi:hypothetical protein
MAKPITGKFNWDSPDVVPSFLQGEDAAAIDEGTRDIRSGVMVDGKFKTKGLMYYDEETQLFHGSTTLLAARVDTLVRPLGIRVASPLDLSRPKILDMVRMKYYSDAPVFVVRSDEDRDSPRNNALLGQIVKEASRFHEKMPYMVCGFDVAPWPEDKDGIGVKIVPRDDFRVIYDKRLGAQYNGWGFSEVDELGLPIWGKGGNKIGDRTWITRNSGLSGFYLWSNLALDTSSFDFISSDHDGRIILISGQPAWTMAQGNFVDRFIYRLKKSE